MRPEIAIRQSRRKMRGGRIVRRAAGAPHSWCFSSWCFFSAFVGRFMACLSHSLRRSNFVFGASVVEGGCALGASGLGRG